jgi:hypothetical protein
MLRLRLRIGRGDWGAGIRARVRARFRARFRPTVSSAVSSAREEVVLFRKFEKSMKMVEIRSGSSWQYF